MGRGLILWDAGDAKQLLLERNVHSNSINSLSFHPKSKILASGGNDGLIKIWKLQESWSEIKLNQCLNISVNSPIKSLSFSDDGHKIASGSSNGKINIWNVENGEKIISWFAYSEEVTSVEFSFKGLLVSGSKNGTVNIWKEG